MAEKKWERKSAFTSQLTFVSGVSAFCDQKYAFELSALLRCENTASISLLITATSYCSQLLQELSQEKFLYDYLLEYFQVEIILPCGWGDHIFHRSNKLANTSW